MFNSYNHLGICNFVELKQNYSYICNYIQIIITINAVFIVNAFYFKNKLKGIVFLISMKHCCYHSLSFFFIFLSLSSAFLRSATTFFCTLKNNSYFFLLDSERSNCYYYIYTVYNHERRYHLAQAKRSFCYPCSQHRRSDRRYEHHHV